MHGTHAGTIPPQSTTGRQAVRSSCASYNSTPAKVAIGKVIYRLYKNVLYLSTGLLGGYVSSSSVSRAVLK